MRSKSACGGLCLHWDSILFLHTPRTGLPSFSACLWRLTSATRCANMAVGFTALDNSTWGGEVVCAESSSRGTGEGTACQRRVHLLREGHPSVLTWN